MGMVVRFLVWAEIERLTEGPGRSVSMTEEGYATPVLIGERETLEEAVRLARSVEGHEMEEEGEKRP